MAIRTLDLLGSDGLINSRSRAKFFGVFQYPDDPLSQRHLEDFLYQFYERQDKGGGPVGLESKFEGAVFKFLNKGLAQRTVAGLVTIYLYQLCKRNDPNPTQYRAGQLAAKFIKAKKKEHMRPLFTNNWVNGRFIQEQYVMSDAPNNIENRFREFSAIGCFAAARLIIGPSDSSVTDQSAANSEFATIISIVAELEAVVYSALPAYFPDPWSIREKLPERLKMGCSLLEAHILLERFPFLPD